MGKTAAVMDEWERGRKVGASPRPHYFWTMYQLFGPAAQTSIDPPANGTPVGFTADGGVLIVVWRIS